MVRGPLELFATPDQIIGRKDQLAEIDLALSLPDSGDGVGFHDPQVLYFVGDGGVGKSRLLREVGFRAEQRTGTLVIGLIDLFLSHYYQPLAMMDTIAEGVAAALERYPQRPLAPSAAERERHARAPMLAALNFAAYRHEVEQYRRKTGGSLEPVQRAFLAGYGAVADAGFALVLLIDTFEKLNPYLEGTERYNFRQDHQLEAWLLNLFGALPVTLVAIAGRPVARQEAAMRARLTGRIHKLELHTFKPDEAREFVEDRLKVGALPSVAPVDPASAPVDPAAVSTPLSEQFYAELYQISSGRPVILAIAVALWRAGLIDLITVSQQLLRGYPANLEPLSDQVVAFILRNLEQRDRQAARFLMKAAYLRRGVTLELLAAIAPVEDSNMTHMREFALFKELVFVKTHHDDTLTLHDEMYELLFNQELTMRVNPLRWYQVARTHTEMALRELGSDDASGISTRPQRQARQLDLLFYRLAEDPRSGYQLYRELSYNAIMAKENDYDDQLQYELARFFDKTTSWGDEYRRRLLVREMPWSRIAFDENVRWVHRRYQTGDPKRFQQAVDQARELAEERGELSLGDSAVILARLESERHISPDPDAVAQAYATVILDLEQYRAELPGTQDASPDWQHATFLLAIALNDRGYFERTRFNLNTAEQLYQSSRRMLDQLDPDSTRLLRAYVLNNLGYAQSQQGNAGQGLNAVKAALTIFQSEGVVLSEAIALNTRAQLLSTLGNFAEALREVAAAKRILLEEGSRAVRNLVLTYRAEGGILRSMADRESDPARREAQFEQAVTCYADAIRLSERAEIDRRIEARRELGATYRSRGYHRSQSGDQGAAEADWRKALDALGEALRVYDELPAPRAHDLLAAGIYQDIAVVYYNLRQYDLMGEALRNARAMIPPDYDIVESVGLTMTPQTEELLSYWLRLGQVELYSSRRLFRLESQAVAPNYLDACERLMRAFACAQRYGERSQQLEQMGQSGLEDLSLVGATAELTRLEKRTRSIAVRLHIEAAHTEYMRPLFEQARNRLANY